MKKILLASLLWLCTWGAIAQVGMGTIDPKAALDIMSSEAGVLIPRMSTSVRESITVGADQNAMLVYDTDTKSFWFYEHSTTAWKELQINDGSGIETLTSLVDNGDGTWTYTDEEGTDTVLNLAAQEPWFGTDDNMGATDNTEDIYTMGHVGIGVDTPAATLEVAGEAGTTTVLDGIIPPRLTGDELRAKTYTAAQTGAMVYITAGDTAPSGQTVNVTTTGTYTFDGTVWKHIENGFKNNRHTMVQGWPDAIRCNFSSPNWGEVTFYQLYSPFSSGTYLYRTIQSGSDYNLIFNSDGTFSSMNATSDCSSKSITELYDEGKAFNFVGGETVRDPDPATNLTSAIAGDIVYDTTDDELQVFNGVSWEHIWSENKWANDNANTQIALKNLSDGSTARPIGSEVVITDTGDLGLGTSSPAATLDVVGDAATPSALDGIIAPRLTGDELRAKTYTVAQTGAMVYVTAPDSAPAGQTVNVTDLGNYVFNGTEWVAVGGSIITRDPDPATNLTSALVGDLAYDTTDDQLQVYNGTAWMSTGKFVDGTNANDAVYTGGHVGIGVDAPAATLEVAGEAGTATVLDGIIPPRLTGDELRAKTYTVAQTGAMVYVTAGDTAPSGQTVNVTTAGTYTFDGTVWKHIENGFKNNRHTMVQGWPDAIRCNLTNPNWGDATFYQIYSPFHTGIYVYRLIHPNGPYELNFNSDGTYNGATNLSSFNCSGKSISELYDEGRAFNFVGGETVRDPDPATNLTSAIAGDIVYDTTDDELQVFNGTTWESIWATGETLTTLALNADGEHLDYTDEEGTVTQINLAATTLATQQVFHAEYAGGTLEADGTDNSITINASNSGAPTFMNYYEASNFETDGGTNDYNVVLRFTLPEDFESWNTNAIVIDFEGTADASFEADVYAQGNATALQDNSAVNGTGLGSFATHTISADTAVNTLVAGATAIILIKLTVTDAATTDTSIIRIGDITLNYNKRRF